MKERNKTWQWIAGILIGTVLGAVFTAGVWTATVRGDVTENTECNTRQDKTITQLQKDAIDSKLLYNSINEKLAILVEGYEK